LEVADSGSRTPPTDLVAGTIFSTSTLSRRGMRRFAIARLLCLCLSVLKKKKDEEEEEEEEEEETEQSTEDMEF
jgi:hypothetical protein